MLPLLVAVGITAFTCSFVGVFIGMWFATRVMVTAVKDAFEVEEK